jgi:hypothetical protein
VLWTGYGAAIAFVGNRFFPDGLWARVALAIALVLLISAVLHQIAKRRRRSP